MVSKRTGRPPGRPSKAAKAAKAVALAEEEGIPLAEAASRLGVGVSTTYRAKASGQVPPPASSQVSAVDLGEADEDANLEVDAIPTLDRVRRLIARTERRTLKAKEGRFAPLAGLLEKLYMRERQLLGPTPPPPDAVLEELRRLDAEAIALIEQHLPDKIDAAELSAVT